MGSCSRIVCRDDKRIEGIALAYTLFSLVRAQFLSEWDSPQASASFEKAYEIILPSDARIRHEQYRQGLALHIIRPLTDNFG
jgi:hypothetical protein